MKILIVCSAGRLSGIGHLSRGVVVGKKLRESLNATIEFIVIGEKAFCNYLCNYNSHSAKNFRDFDLNIKSWADKIQPDLVIFDLDERNILPGFELALRYLRQKNIKLIAVDGMFTYRDILDLIFLPAISCPHEYLVDCGAPIIFGWDCLLLNVVERDKSTRSSSKDILILTGGGDPMSLGRTWPQLLNNYLKSETNIHWVKGPFADFPGEIKHKKINLTIHDSPKGLGGLMSKVGYAATVLGVSFFELLYYGVPTVVFSPYGEKDLFTLNEIEKLGLAKVAKNEREATEMLAQLMRDDEMALNYSRKALSFFKTSTEFRLEVEIRRLFS